MKIRVELDETYKDVSVTIQAPEATQEVEEIVGLLERKNGSCHLTGFQEEKMRILKPCDICRLSAWKGRVIAETQSDQYEIRMKLYEVEHRLKKGTFIRISRSEIINMDWIDYFECDFTGTLVIVLRNGKKTYVSRRYTKNIKERLGV